MFKSKNNILLYIIFFLFACLTFFIGLHHEPWVDEAQSWLIARDCSLYDIVFTRCSYEGTPFLWFFILKFFIFTGLSYKYLFVISWLFSCLGVYLFLFKSSFPTVIKIFFPFGFYIFYQYAVIARSYCLFLPLLGLTALFYDKRFDKPYLYCTLLALLATVHAYGFVIAFILLSFFVCDTITDAVFFGQPYPAEVSKKSFFKQAFHGFSISQFIGISAVVIYFLFIVIICKKNSDCDFVQKNLFSDGNIIGKILTAFFGGYFNVTNPFLFFTAMFSTLSLYYVCAKTFCKNKKQIVYFIVLNFFVYLAIVAVNFYDWHLGIIWLVLIFSLWVLQKRNNIHLSFKNNKIFYIVFLTILLFQIFYAAQNSLIELNKDYDGAEKIAGFLKQNNFKKGDIVGLGYRVTAIQPYFKENIFVNKDTAYYPWSKKYAYREIENTRNILDKTKIFIADKDIVSSILYKEITDYINDNCSHNFVVDSDMYIKGEKFNSRTVYYVFNKGNAD